MYQKNRLKQIKLNIYKYLSFEEIPHGDTAYASANVFPLMPSGVNGQWHACVTYGHLHMGNGTCVYI